MPQCILGDAHLPSVAAKGQEGDVGGVTYVATVDPMLVETEMGQQLFCLVNV
jgi:hypothetical protein